MVCSVLPPAFYLSRYFWTSYQVAYPDEDVGRSRQDEHPAEALDASMPGFAHQAHGLEPAKDFLDPSPFLMTHQIAGMPGGATIDGIAAPLTPKFSWRMI